MQARPNHRSVRSIMALTAGVRSIRPDMHRSRSFGVWQERDAWIKRHGDGEVVKEVREGEESKGVVDGTVVEERTAKA